MPTKKVKKTEEKQRTSTIRVPAEVFQDMQIQAIRTYGKPDVTRYVTDLHKSYVDGRSSR